MNQFPRPFMFSEMQVDVVSGLAPHGLLVWQFILPSKGNVPTLLNCKYYEHHGRHALVAPGAVLITLLCDLL